MKAIIRAFCCAALLAPLAGRAAEPKSGRVLVIDYDRLIEGDIERVGDRFRIRHGGGEMTVPATPTMIVVADREAAYQLLRGRSKLNEPLERVRLSRWCLHNDLKRRAVEEAEAALALRPDEAALKRFVQEVKAQVALAAPTRAPETQPAPKRIAPEPAVVDVNPESFSLFVTKVQPLLMNACGQCHCSERGGAFRLQRTATTFGDKRATQINLSAVSAFLNRERPSASPVLVHALSVHGDCARPPLRDRQAPAFKYLEEWARLATGKPLTPPPAAPPATLPGDAVAGALPLAPEAPGKDPGTETPPVVVVPALRREKSDDKTAPVIVTKATDPAATKPATPAAEPPKSEPADPFDPALFNKPNQTPKP